MSKTLFALFYSLILLLIFGLSLYLFEFYSLSTKKEVAEVDFTKVKEKLIQKSIEDKKKYYYYLSSCNFLNPNIKKNKFHKKANKLDIFPLSINQNANIIASSEGEEWSIFKSDRYGYRNLDKNWDLENSHYFFGDSYSISSHVSEKNALHTLINKKNKILNLGMGCWSPPEYYAIKKEMKNALNNSTIPSPLSLNLLYYLGNDYSHPILQNDQGLLSDYFQNEKFNQNLFSKKYLEKINILANFYDDSVKNDVGDEQVSGSRSLNIFRKLLKPFDLVYTRAIVKRLIANSDVSMNAYGSIISNENKNFTKMKKFIEKDIEISIKICKKYKCKISLFALPSYGDFFLVQKNKKKPSFYFEEYLQNISKKHNINFVSVYNEFLDITNDPSELFPNGEIGHFSIKGYKYLAEIIGKNL